MRPFRRYTALSPNFLTPDSLGCVRAPSISPIWPRPARRVARFLYLYTALGSFSVHRYSASCSAKLLSPQLRRFVLSKCLSAVPLLPHRPSANLPRLPVDLCIRTYTISPLLHAPSTISPMARKLADSTSESSLSPLPEDLKTPSTATVSDSLLVKAAVNGKKRKVETTVKTTKKRKTVAEDPDGGAEEAEKPKKRARKVKVEEETVEHGVKVEENGAATKVKATQKRQRKKKEETVAPLEERTEGSKLRVGAHVSIAGGVHNAITNVLHIGANAFALFLKNQRKWTNPALDPEHATLFLDGCKGHNIEAGDCCLPHGSYLVNLAHPDEERKKQAYDSFHDDLTRCHKLGIKLYNFHPGNANATTREGGIRLIADAINKAHKDPDTGIVVPLLETMASLGNTIGGTFEDLAAIIDHVDDKDRIGVCLDTCHVFAAGYDLRTPEAYTETMAEFDKVIGIKYLKALHINDSKAPLSSHRDLHARIGTGYLGLRSFHNIVNDERLHGLPMVLETPIDVKDENGKKTEDKSIWAREIKMLEKLVGMDVESEEFKKWEADLFEEGAGERERIGDQVKRKQEKDSTPKKRAKKQKVESEEEAEDNEV